MIAQITAFITWTFDPNFLTKPITIRWYGMMFAIGFIFGVWLISKMFKHEGEKSSWAATLFIYVVICTIVGARLGHVFFYAWDEYYSKHLLDIFKIWEGGLASHGGAIGIIIGLFIYSKYVTKRNVLWACDRLVVPTAFVGGLIRLGNLFNHEIYGHATNLPWGFRFIENLNEWMNGAAPIFSQPSHPTQIYEALSYFAIFALLMYLYWKRNEEERQGLLSGIFFIGVFGMRFLIEFIKNPQEDFEAAMTLNMGQWLSIPFILLGVILIAWAMKHPRTPIVYKNEFAPESKKK